MPGLVFVDTNVLLYAMDARESVKQRAATAWLDRLWRDRAGRTSMQVISEFYYNLERISDVPLKRAEAWEIAESYLAWTPQPIDADLMRRARDVEQRWRLSWWDSLIVAAAQVQDCTLLLTEDLHDGARYDTVVVRSPFTAGVNEPVAEYAPTPPVLPRHRGRGRPAKASASVAR